MKKSVSSGNGIIRNGIERCYAGIVNAANLANPDYPNIQPNIHPWQRTEQDDATGRLEGDQGSTGSVRELGVCMIATGTVASVGAKVVELLNNSEVAGRVAWGTAAIALMGVATVLRERMIEDRHR